MLRTGDLVVPTVNGEDFLHTPPLFYWLLALWFSLAGTEPDGVARLLPVACGAGTLLVTYFLARRHAGRRAGLVSAGVLASTFHFWDVSHRVTVDMALTLSTSMALFFLAAIALEPRVRPWWGPLFGACAGSAFLVKGVVGPGFLALVAAATFLLHRDLWTRGRLVALLSGAMTAAAVSLPWIAALYARDPAYPWELGLEHVWERAAGGTAHNPSNWQFLHRLLLHAMPWTILLPFVFHAQGRRAWGRSRAEEHGTGERSAARFTEFLLLSFLLPLIALLVSRGKRNLYLLPAMPALALLTGIWLENHLDARVPRRLATALLWIGALAAPVGLVATLSAAPASSSALVLAALVAHFYWTVWGTRRRRREKEAPSSAIGLPPEDAPLSGGEPRGRSSRELSPTVYTALLLLTLSVAAWGSFHHVLTNPRSTAAPLGGRMAALESQGFEIAGYGLFQREIAAVAWYLRHSFPHAEERERLRELVEAAVPPRPDGAPPDRRLALMVEMSALEAITDLIPDWKDVHRTKLRGRQIIVMVPPSSIPASLEE
jgi:4-amino-4-deoxy-L-arabinose transferase-like glycosyltransferase